VSEAPRGEPFDDGETLFAELVARLLGHELQHERTAAKIDRLDQFASVLAHDIRNPLSVAESHIQATQGTGDTAEIGPAADGSDRIQTIISDVLMVARQGRMVDATEEVQLAVMAEQCWESVTTADATLTVVDRQRFRAAPDRLRHRFENLFRNAVENGSTSVTIRVGALGDDDGFYVEDDGSGIPADQQEAIFEQGVTTGGEGIGLGLAIVDAVVGAHGWEVDVTENTDGGARFEVRDVLAVESLFN
jgi:signal transduction histidine kinase